MKNAVQWKKVKAIEVSIKDYKRLINELINYVDEWNYCYDRLRNLYKENVEAKNTIKALKEENKRLMDKWCKAEMQYNDEMIKQFKQQLTTEQLLSSNLN